MALHTDGHADDAIRRLARTGFGHRRAGDAEPGGTSSEIRRSFGNGYLRAARDERGRTWQEGDTRLADLVRLCLFSGLAAGVVVLIAATGYLLSIRNGCKTNSEVNRFVHRQSVDECVVSKLDRIWPPLRRIVPL